MSDDVKKKNKERDILSKIFRDNLVPIEECEQPDFILRYGENNIVGVEITELYYDGTSARLKNKEGYVKDLIENKKFIHKADKKKLKVHEIEYYSQTKNYSPIKMNALFLPKYNIEDYRKAIYLTLIEKNKKVLNYNKEIKEFILVIYDCEERFKEIEEEDIAKNLFDEKIKKAIQRSNFSEINLITVIQGKECYLPLKAYIFLSEAYMLFDYIKEKQLIGRLEQLGQDFLDVFAEVLLNKGYSEVNCGYYEKKKIIYCHRYGLGIEFKENENNDWGFGIYDTFPNGQFDIVGTYCLEEENDFFTAEEFLKYEKYYENKIVSSGLFFKTL